MFFSVICASKNEEKIIHKLIDSFLCLNYPDKELLIIDDSSDDTKKIIKSYLPNSKIKLIDGNNNGCCEARNLGIKNSIGDIIIFMTADSFFDCDFIYKIKPYYEKGYDAVMVNSLIANRKGIWSDFLQCFHENKIATNKNYSPLTTQGYSVKKSTAEKVGLIDSGIFKPNICRDWTLIKKMDSNGYRKIFLKNVRCKHIAPDTSSEFILTQKIRGQISAGYNYKFRKKNLFFLFFYTLAKLLNYLIFKLIFLKVFIQSYKLQKYSQQENKKFVIPKFILVDMIKNFSFIYGEFKTYIFFLLKKY